MAGEHAKQVSLGVLAAAGLWIAVYWIWQPGGSRADVATGAPIGFEVSAWTSEEETAESSPNPLAKVPVIQTRPENQPAQSRPAPGTEPEEQAPTSADDLQEPAEQAPASPPVAKVYTVQKGDTLSAISLREYGSVRYTDLIFRANRDVLRERNALQLGMRLVLPPLEE